MAKRQPKSKGKGYDAKSSSTRGSRGDNRKGNPTHRGNPNPKTDGKSYASDQHGITEREYSNNPNWYKRSGLLTLNTSNIATQVPIGVLMSTNLGNYTPAGIARYDYLPCFGDFNAPTDPINYVSRLVYNTVNSKNSRSDRYDPSDLMTYIIGVANAWSLHSCILRIIGMFNTYSVLNRYWWDDVLATMGVAPIDATNDIMKWVTVANKIALTLNTLPVPKGFSYFERAQMMPCAVYVDMPVDKSSLYYFMPSELFKFGYDSEGKGQLTTVPTPFASDGAGIEHRIVTPAKIEAFFNNLTEHLINDSDIRYMGADIMKAYGNELYTIPQVDHTFKQGFQFDPMVNLQLRNANVHRYIRTPGAGYKIYQDMTKNCLVSTPMRDCVDTSWTDPSVMWYRHAHRVKDHIFDFPTMEVDNDLVIEATKLHPVWLGDSKFVATAEVLVNDYIYSYIEEASGPILTEMDGCSVVGFPRVITSDGTYADPFYRMDFASKIAAAPLQYLVAASGGTEDAPIYNPPTMLTLNDDLTNYTTISLEMMRDQAMASVTSLFAPFDLS